MDVVPEPTSFTSNPVFYLLLTVAALLAGFVYWFENSRLKRYGNMLPGPPTVPLFGNALNSYGSNPEDILKELIRDYHVYGNVARVFIGPRLFVFLIDPVDVEIILSSPIHIDKAPEYKFFKPWLGDGLLISKGDKWRSHRKMIAPTFHLNILKTFVPLFYENSRDLVTRLKSEVGKEFDCHDYLSAVTVDILLETAMGTRNTKDDRAGYDYAMAVMEMCNIIYRRSYNLILRLDCLFKYTSLAKKQKQLIETIHGLTRKVINEKKLNHLQNITSNMTKGVEARGNKSQESGDATSDYQGLPYIRDDLDEIDENDVGEKRRLAFLDLLLELSRNGAQLNDEEIKEEVDTIMFEGHDTTAAGSSFVLCVLGIHQDIQDRVHAEMDEIFKGSNRQCTFQDTLQMKYLERVIMETLRLFPPVPVIARQLNEDVKLASRDNIVPRGSVVLIPQMKIHRLPEYYPNPDEFNPDNFLAENMQKRHYYSFIPFSAGPRSCVGRKYAMLKLKVLISTILRSYRIHSDLTEKDFRLQADIILKRTDGFRIKIEPLNANVNS